MIILAAGSSTRMGKIKQLMLYKNKTLLQYIICEAKNANLDPVICVTGFESDLITGSISGTAVSIVYNGRWPEGMGSGISIGINQLLLSDVDSVILAVSDQPHVSSDLFLTMIEEKNQSGKGIVASKYADTLGTPVLFDKMYFQKLQALKGEQGAKKLIQSEMSDVAIVSFEKGNIDIDTIQDYQNLIAETP